MVLRVLLLFVFGLIVATLFVWGLASRETGKRISALEAERALAETRHGRIEYIAWGDGPPVLVIHGSGGGFDQGRLIAEAVGSEGFRFIAVSRFGYLGSHLPPDASTKAQTEAFADLLDALGIDRAHVLAMSGGVPPSLKLAELYPDRTGRMALLSSAPFTPFGPEVEDRPMPTWGYAALLGNDTVYWALSKIARGQLRAAFDARDELLEGASPEEAEFVERLIDGFLPASRRLRGVNNEGAAVDPAMSYDLGSIQSRVLVVHARDDRLNPFDVAETIDAQIPQSQLVALESGGHLLLGHHTDLREAVDAFFAGEE